MDIQKRILLCRIIEKMKANPEYAQTLKLENNSTLHGNETKGAE